TGEFDVAESHAARVDEGNKQVPDEERGRTDRGAEQCVEITRDSAGCAEQNGAHNIGGYDDHVGEPVVVEVDEDEGDRDCGEVEKRDEDECGGKPRHGGSGVGILRDRSVEYEQGDAGEDHGGGEFDEGVARGDLRSAV